MSSWRQYSSRPQSMEFGIHYMPMPIMEVSLKSGQKLNLNAPNGPFGPVGDNLKLAVKECYQTGQFFRFSSIIPIPWKVFHRCQWTSTWLGCWFWSSAAQYSHPFVFLGYLHWANAKCSLGQKSWPNHPQAGHFCAIAIQPTDPSRAFNHSSHHYYYCTVNNASHFFIPNDYYVVFSLCYSSHLMAYFFQYYHYPSTTPHSSPFSAKVFPSFRRPRHPFCDSLWSPQVVFVLQHIVGKYSAAAPIRSRHPQSFANQFDSFGSARQWGHSQVLDNQQLWSTKKSNLHCQRQWSPIILDRISSFQKPSCLLTSHDGSVFSHQSTHFCHPFAGFPALHSYGGIAAQSSQHCHWSHDISSEERL